MNQVLRDLRVRAGSLCNDDNPDRLCDRAQFVFWCVCIALVAVGTVMAWFLIFVLLPLCGIAWVRISGVPLPFETDHVCETNASTHDLIDACVYTPFQKCACQLEGGLFIVLLCCGFVVGYFMCFALIAIYRAIYCYKEQRRALVTDAWPDDENDGDSDAEIPNVMAFMFDERNPHALGSLNDQFLRIKGMISTLTGVAIGLFLVWFVGAILLPLLGYALCSGEDGATKRCNVSSVGYLMRECTYHWRTGCQCFWEGLLLFLLIVILVACLVLGIGFLVRACRSAKTPQEMTALHGNQLAQQQQQQYGACHHGQNDNDADTGKQ
jgi:hypothetical protein